MRVLNLASKQRRVSARRQVAAGESWRVFALRAARIAASATRRPAARSTLRCAAREACGRALAALAVQPAARRSVARQRRERAAAEQCASPRNAAPWQPQCAPDAAELARRALCAGVAGGFVAAVGLAAVGREAFRQGPRCASAHGSPARGFARRRRRRRRCIAATPLARGRRLWRRRGRGRRDAVRDRRRCGAHMARDDAAGSRRAVGTATVKRWRAHQIRHGHSECGAGGAEQMEAILGSKVAYPCVSGMTWRRSSVLPTCKLQAPSRAT